MHRKFIRNIGPSLTISTHIQSHHTAFFRTKYISEEASFSIFVRVITVKNYLIMVRFSYIEFA